MATKCIDHMPPPIVVAASTSHTRRAGPRAVLTRPPRSRAVYDAKEATRMDRATRWGSCVPVAIIGIVPIFGPETSGRRARRLSGKSTAIRSTEPSPRPGGPGGSGAVSKVKKIDRLPAGEARLLAVVGARCGNSGAVSRSLPPPRSLYERLDDTLSNAMSGHRPRLRRERAAVDRTDGSEVRDLSISLACPDYGTPWS